MNKSPVKYLRRAKTFADEVLPYVRGIMVLLIAANLKFNLTGESEHMTTIIFTVVSAIFIVFIELFADEVNNINCEQITRRLNKKTMYRKIMRKLTPAVPSERIVTAAGIVQIYWDIAPNQRQYIEKFTSYVDIKAVQTYAVYASHKIINFNNIASLEEWFALFGFSRVMNEHFYLDSMVNYLPKLLKRKVQVHYTYFGRTKITDLFQRVYDEDSRPPVADSIVNQMPSYEIIKGKTIWKVTIEEEVVEVFRQYRDIADTLGRFGGLFGTRNGFNFNLITHNCVDKILKIVRV